jgi:hypothetical protein
MLNEVQGEKRDQTLIKYGILELMIEYAPKSDLKHPINPT